MAGTINRAMSEAQRRAEEKEKKKRREEFNAYLNNLGNRGPKAETKTSNIGQKTNTGSQAGSGTLMGPGGSTTKQNVQKIRAINQQIDANRRADNIRQTTRHQENLRAIRAINNNDAVQNYINTMTANREGVKNGKIPVTATMPINMRYLKNLTPEEEKKLTAGGMRDWEFMRRMKTPGTREYKMANDYDAYVAEEEERLNRMNQNTAAYRQKRYEDFIRKMSGYSGYTDEEKGSWGSGQSETIRNDLNLKNFRGTMAEREAKRRAGELDYLGDYAWMSDAGLAAEREKWQKQLDESSAPSWDEERDNRYARAGRINEAITAGGFQTDGGFGWRENRGDNYAEGGSDREDADRALYDYVMGEGAYDQAVEALETDEDVEDLEARMERAWDAFESREMGDDERGAAIYEAITGGNWQKEDDAYELAKANRRIAQGKLDQITYQENNNQRYSELMSGTHEGDASYHPEFVDSKRPIPMDGFYANSSTADIYEVYSYINGGKVADYWRNKDGELNVREIYRNAGMMLDPEIEEFNRLFNKNPDNPTEAQAFLDGLQWALNARYRVAEEIENRDMAHRLPILSTAMTFMDTAGEAGTFLAGRFGDLIGADWQKDPNSFLYRNTRHKQDTRGQVTEDLPEGWKTVYGAATSGIDSALNVLMAKGMGATGKSLERLTLALFGSQAFQNSMYQHLDETQGQDYGRAVFLSAVDTLIEEATEIWSVENLLGDPTELWKYLAKNAFSEGSEELVGSTVGEAVKALASGKSSWTERGDQIYDAGGYYGADGKWVDLSGLDDRERLNEAHRQALREWEKEIAESTLSGALSTGGGAIVGPVRNAGSRIQTGGTISGKNGGINSLVEAAGMMKEGTKSRKQAEAIMKDMAAGKKVSNYRIGKLAESVYVETGESVSETTKGVLSEKITRDLMEGGMEQTEAMETADAIAKARLEGPENLNREEQEKITGSALAMNTLGDYLINEETNAKVEEEVGKRSENEMAARQTVDQLVQKESDQISTAAGDVAEAVKEAKASVAGTAELTLTAGKRTGNMDAVVDGEFRQISGYRDGQLVVKDRKGNETTVESGNAKFVNGTVAAAVRLAETRNDLISGRYANQMIQAVANIKNEADGAKALDDMMKIRLAAMSEGQMTATTLDKKTAQALYDDARAEYEENNENRVVNQDMLKPGEGVATYNGAEYGTEEFSQQMKGMTKKVRDQVGAMSEIAVRAGFRVNFINDEENSDIYGWEDAKTGTVTVNMAAAGGKSNRNLLTIAGHEFTHWLEQNSKEGYAALRSFVLSSLRKSGKNVEGMLTQLISERNAIFSEQGSEEKLDLNGAMAELVANACDQVLGNKQVIDTLKNENPSLYNKAKQFVKDFVARIRNAVSSMKGSTTRESRAMMDYADELARLWLGAREEALGREAGGQEGETAENGGIQLSAAQRSSFTIDPMLSFRDQLSQWMKLDEEVKAMPNRSMFVGTTPEVLTKIGMAKLPMTIDYSHIRASIEGKYSRDKYRDDHIFDIEVFGHLPELIADPIAVIKDSKPGSVRVIVSMKAKSGKDVLVPIKINARKTLQGLRLDANDIETVHGNIDTISSLRSAIKKDSAQDNRVYYINKEKTLLAVPGCHEADLASLGGAGGFIHNIPESDLVVNDKKSGRKETIRKQTDTIQFKNWFGNSRMTENGKTMKRDGVPKVFYHGTNSGKFTVFDKNLIGKARDGDVGFFGKGFYFAYSEGEASMYGKNVIPVFLKIEKPFNFQTQLNSIDGKRTYDYNASRAVFVTNFAEKFPELAGKHKVTVWEKGTGEAKEISLAEFAAQYRDVIKNKKFEVEEIDGELGTEWLVTADTHEESFTNEDGEKFTWNEHGFQKKYMNKDDAYNKLSNAYQYLAETVYDGIRIPNSINIIQETDFSTAVQSRGYDGIIQSKDGDEAVVFEPTQIKSATENVGFFDPNNPDINYSAAQRDEAYMEAAEAGDTETLQRLVDEAAEEAFRKSKARTPDGKLMPVYHGTKADFNIFDTSVSGGVNGTQEGFGIYLTDDPKVTESYGNRRISGYVDMQRPAYGDRKTIRKAELAKLIKATCEAEARQMVEDGEYDTIKEAIQDTWISNYLYTPEYGSITAAYNAVADTILQQNDNDADIINEVMGGQAIRNYSEAMDFYHNILTPTTGIDGIWQKWPDRITGREANILLAFDSSQIKEADPIIRDDNGNIIPLSERFNRNDPDIRYSMAQVSQQDQEYADAVARGDMKRATEMLMDKLAHSENIIPFNAPNWYGGQHKDIAKLIKEGTPEAVARAAADMASFVPDNAVLIPTPPHEGMVKDDTDTKILAEAIGELTGRPVVVALESDPRESRYKAKSEGRKGVRAEDMGFRMVEELPEGTIPIFIDNVVGSGETAKAAMKAAGGGITLSYAKSTLSKGIEGLKRATVTYDKQGNLIQLSKRFDASKRDIRYSTAQADMEVNQWMMSLNEKSLNTVQERNLLKQYKDARVAVDLARKALGEYESEIRRIEKIANPTAYDREKLRKQEEGRDKWRKKLDKAEEDLARITSDKGYAGLMKKQQKLMNDLVNGRTAEEVIATADAIAEKMKEVDKAIAERAEELRKLDEKAEVAAAKSYFAGTNIKEMAKYLKDNYQSDIAATDVESRLAAIALKLMKNNFNMDEVMDDMDELAARISGKRQADYESYAIEELRGTYALSESQMKELKGQHRTLRDLQRELAGTGIRFRKARPGEVTLDNVYGQLMERIPSLEDVNDKDQVDAILNLVRAEKRGSMMIDDAGLMEDLRNEIMTTVIGLTGSSEAENGGNSQVKALLKSLDEIRNGGLDTAEAIEDVRKQLAAIVQEAGKARAGAQKIEFDVGDAIKYFNTITEQSEAAVWRSERSKLILQMKDENTMNLLKEQEKWKQRIERDKTVRKMIQDNLRLQMQITTNIARIRKRLEQETDQKNVPEHLKGLAREMVRLIVENDLRESRVYKVTTSSLENLERTQELLNIWRKKEGDFDIHDLSAFADPDIQETAADALADIEDGLGFLYNKGGKDRVANLQGIKNALTRVKDGVTTITSIIKAESSIIIEGRRIAIEDAAYDVLTDAEKSRFKGEYSGTLGKAVAAIRKAIVSGNMTPVYFFKNLRNGGMARQWREFERGENRNGLELQKAKEFMEKTAAETGYGTWDLEKRYEVSLSGYKAKMTLEQMMALYATWKREHTLGPEMSNHLINGGVYVDEGGNNEGVIGRVMNKQRAHKMTKEDAKALAAMLTAEQKEYVDRVVGYLSKEMSELGNEASLRMYGIEKYKEDYYFPMKIWNGIRNAKSDAGAGGMDENRIAHQSFSKRRVNKARNALVIGNFTDTAVGHMVQMINYVTMAPALENLNRVLNYQVTTENGTKQNVETAFGESYGEEARKYLRQWMQDLNGGVTQDPRKTLRERALSTFKKNAVAGSLSVSLQQPLSYIRAAVMVNPKYLVKALSPKYWKGSYQEMIRNSGVAVIKDMGRFDMSMGQSAKDYLTPDKKTGKGRAALNWVSDKTTVLPEMMDRMTWTRMWSAVKAETADRMPGVDQNSERFLYAVAERFNELMRRTQVYDSTLVKSSNMRSQNYAMKVLTSFMAEPTLTLNVLSDAVVNVKEKGGKLMLAKAGAAFAASAVLQAVVKGLMGAGRNPDDKKTWEENFLNRFGAALLSEANPVSMIPGYSDLIEVLKNGELQDDAMGALGKIKTIIDTTGKMIGGNGRGVYRDLEDTAGQLAQLFTNIPAKNIMRDMRAMYNTVMPGKYAGRETSGAVIRYQARDTIMTGDNLLGVINTWLGEAGYKVNNEAYYRRIYEADRAGNQKASGDMIEYLLKGKGVKESAINSKLRGFAKNDDDMELEEKIEAMKGYGTSEAGTVIVEEYTAGKVNREEAERLYRKEKPNATDKDVMETFDKAERKARGVDVTGYSNYTPLREAMDANKAEQIRNAVGHLLDNGYKAKDIKTWITTNYKAAYLDAKDGSPEKVKIRDAIEKAYKAAGFTAEDARKAMEGWNKDKKGSTK